MDEVAKTWKKKGGPVIVAGEGDQLKTILRTVEGSMSGGKLESNNALSRQSSLLSTDQGLNERPTTELRPNTLSREDSLGMSSLNVDEVNEKEQPDPRRWLKVVDAFQQPRLAYDPSQKHFEVAKTSSSLLPDPSHKTSLFRQRYHLVQQRLLRNEAFQTSAIAASRKSSLQRSASSVATAQQAYKLTPIANLLGRSGTSHMLLGLLAISPAGSLMVSDLTGSIIVDIQHARPIPDNGAWFTPGMMVLVDGVYEEEGSAAGPGLEGNGGIGGTLGGKFIAFSVGGPPCERRELTMGVSNIGEDNILSAGGGFGWVDFLGVGSERSSGPEMRKLERSVLRGGQTNGSTIGRGRMLILGDVELDSPKSLQALRKVLGLYAAEPAEATPMAVVLMGNFVRHAAMAGNSGGGSIEYKEQFDSLASVLSEYPTMLQSTTFIFIPGDNDPWASSFSAGAATVLPRKSIPELFTSRIKRAFTTANAEAEKSVGRKTDGEAIWSSNPARVSLFGPAQEIVLFRDDISGRLRRNAVRFQPQEQDTAPSVEAEDSGIDSHIVNQEEGPKQHMAVDSIVEIAESHVPQSKHGEPTDPAASFDIASSRKLVKTLLDQGYLSPFPLNVRPVLWDYAAALQLYPLPSALVLMDPEAPPYTVTYEGCHVMNPGPLAPRGHKGLARWLEYDSKTRRGRIREARYQEFSRG